MGITLDLLNSKSLDPSSNADGLKRILRRYVNELIEVSGDPAYVNPAANEVQSIAPFNATVSGGTYTLTIKVANGETFTTDAIPHNTAAPGMKTAIDVAATGVITDWTNGDISTSGEDLVGSTVVLTFDGASVSGRAHFLTVIDGTNLTGGGSVGLITVTTPGVQVRPSLETMSLIGLVTNMPSIGVLPLASDYTNVKPGSLHLNPNELVLKMLADEAGIENGNIGVGGAAIRDEHLRLMREQGFAV